MENSTEQNPFELIYYGSPLKKVYLKLIEAKKLPFHKDLFVNKLDNQTLSSSLLYKFSWRHLGPHYSNFYVIAVPANDLIYKTPDVELETCGNSPESILDCGMIKVKETVEHEYTGYQSGMRSAIIPFNGKYYRLKGCGNLDAGFTAREMGFPKGTMDVRGCQFRNTCAREQYFSNLVGEAISKYGFEINNKPVGMWLYSPNIEDRENGITNAYKRIDKMCSVYEIISEKRLGCHLIPGLEMMMTEYLKNFIEENQSIDYKNLIAELFPKERAYYNNEKTEIKEINRTYEYINILELLPGDTINSIFDKYSIYSSLDSEGMLVNPFELLTLKGKNHQILSHFTKEDLFKTLLENYFTEHKTYEIFDNHVNKNSTTIINEKLEKMNQLLNSKKYHFLEILSMIYARAGWEGGMLKRITQDNGINWGSYEDLKFRLHCNAHTDNYAVIPKGKSQNHNLLAILDFDLAFARENFVNIADENDDSKYGYPDDYLFDFYLNVERQHLEWEFGGIENVVIYEHYKAKMHSDPMFQFYITSFVSLLRDISVIYFRKGYLQQEFDLKEKYLQMFDDVHEMIDIAMMVSHDFIG